jgi:hypothetical protein
MSKTASTTDFEMVLEIHNANDRVFLRSILDAESIDYFIQGETVAPYIFNSVPMRLMVKKNQVEKVHDLLQRFIQSPAYGGLTRVMEKASGKK